MKRSEDIASDLLFLVEMKGFAALPVATLMGFGPRASAREGPPGTRALAGSHPWNSLQYEKRPIVGALSIHGGDEGIRTLGLCLAKAALSQLSYIPLSKCKSHCGN